MDEDTDDAARKRQVALGKAIRRYRGDLSQAELGRRIGVPQTTVSRWEAGHVDLGVEQIRVIEVALGLALGTLVRAAGYVELTTADDEVPDAIRVTYFATFDAAHDALIAADVIGLGVRLCNRWIPADDDDGSQLEWVMTLLPDPPGGEVA